jgi:hypothetical protein
MKIPPPTPIKFRVWDKKQKQFAVLDDDTLFEYQSTGLKYFQRKLDKYHDYIIQQYTGVSDCNGNELYQGDIVFLRYFGSQDEHEKTYNLFEIIFSNGAFLLKPIKLFLPKNPNDVGGNQFFRYTMEMDSIDKDNTIHYSRKMPPPQPLYNLFRVCVRIGNIFQNPELFEQNDKTN